ncbi:MAG: ABC transporter permease [candidate division GAL15 bacterium]
MDVIPYLERARGWLVASLLIGTWACIVELRWVPRAFLPSPVEVGRGFVEILGGGVLARHTLNSMARFFASYIVASGLGVVAGVGMGILPVVGRWVRPLVVFFNAIAGVAWLPLAMLWFGTGEPTVAFVTVNGIFFVVVVNTLAGVQSVPSLYIQGVQVLGAGKMQVIWQVLLPGALPAVVSGLRLAMGFGWRALVASEMLAAASGLGYLIYRASYDFRYDVVWAGILLVGLLNIGIDRVVFVRAERWIAERWA